MSDALKTFQHINKYARWIESKGRRETWKETVSDRVMPFFRNRYGGALTRDEWASIEGMLLREDASFAMRVIQMAGPAMERCNVAGYNCAYTPISRVADFSDILYILMQGTGCAFSVEQKYVSQLPVVAKQLAREVIKFKVDDSTEGWCNALDFGLEHWFVGRDVEFDYSDIRPAGSRLKTKGGYASGPGPLKDLLDFVRVTLLDAAGRQLTDFEVHRICCKIGRIVEVGGVRRAAMLSLSDLNSAAMRSCKNDYFWETMPELSMANNSAAYDGPLDKAAFDIEWNNLKNSGTGERGIFNRSCRIPVRRERRDFGTNPCVTGDTWVNTKSGPYQVKDLINIPHKTVVDGVAYNATGFWSTGNKPVFRINTDAGYNLKATADHKILTDRGWVQTKDLVVGTDRVVLSNNSPREWEGRGSFSEGWLLGNLYGDGNLTSTTANLEYWGDNRYEMLEVARKRLQELGCHSDCGTAVGNVDLNRVRVGSRKLRNLAEAYGMENKIFTPDLEKTSSAFSAGFLRGWFDADGSVQGSSEKGYSIRLSSVYLDGLFTAQRMLARFGILSKVYQNRRLAGYRKLPDGRGGLKDYFCSASHELIISRENLNKFAMCIGFDDENKQVALTSALNRSVYKDRTSSLVVDVEYIGVEEVYDCTVDVLHAFDANGIIVHNCGEIVLRPKQFCNLSMAIVRPDDDLSTIMAKVRMAAIMGTLQAGLTKFQYISGAWQANCREEALLGVDIMGALDNPIVQAPGILEVLQSVIQQTNAIWADKIGIRRAAATTCIKPGGNSSERYGTGNSITGWYARYIHRRVRVNNIDPMCQFLKDQGVPWEASVYNEPVTVFSFYKKAPDTAVLRGGRTIEDQLDWWLRLKTEWTEHNPSVTIYVKSDEWDKVKAWVLDNWDNVGGLAFLPYNDSVYPQQPLSEMTEQEYNEAVAKFPQIDWELFGEYERLLGDTTTVGQEMACLGGACEL